MRIAIAALAILLLSGCGVTTPPPSVMSPSIPVAPTASPDPTASPSPTLPTSARVDAGLLAVLPSDVDGVAGQPDPETAAEVARDALLQGAIDAISIAIYVAPRASGTSSDYAVATVVHLRPGVFSAEFYRDWRDTFDTGVCEQAGGVNTHAEASIRGRQTYIATCAGGVKTHHAYLQRSDVLVSIQGVGDRRFGERIVEGLTE
ncbi:MAG: hypothetical protein ABIQ58_03410 [Candidatus Limnocylindrales bacterium]